MSTDTRHPHYDATLQAAIEQMHSQAKHHLQLLSDWQARAELAEAELAECHAKLLDTTAASAVLAERARRYATKSAYAGYMTDEMPAEPSPQPPTPPPWQPAVGDVVRLKSGGPAMTVHRIGDVVTCYFFTDGYDYRHVDASAACLTPAKEAQP